MLSWLFDYLSNVPENFQIIVFVLALAAGFVFLVKGADVFVTSASEIAKKLKIPAIVIGLTIVSIGTSAPEVAVNIVASFNGNQDIALGNVVGSNIFNILVVLGVSSLFFPIAIKRKIIGFDLNILLITTLLLLLMAITIPFNDHKIILAEGIILIIGVILYIIYNVVKSIRQPHQEEQSNEVKKNTLIIILFLILGLITIIAGGELVNYGAVNVALEFGVSEALVGLTIVAAGTSLPELVTSVIATRKKENEIAIGNVIGSCIFNILFIIGISSIISPLNIVGGVIYDVIILSAITTIFVIYCYFKNQIDKKVGLVMILTYVIYVIYLISLDTFFK